MFLASHQDYHRLVEKISELYQQSRRAASHTVNRILLETYWEMGRYIVEFEQEGEEKAEYGTALLENLSKDLKARHGRGFSRSNLNYMRLVYQRYPICEEVPHKLSWTHLCELVKIDDPLERSFYEKQSVLENWSTTELKRQKKSSLYLRLAGSLDKEGILRLAQEGKVVQQAEDLIREPYVLEFLKIPAPNHLSEKELEARLINHLQHFLLELGKGFAFVGRQYRVSLGNRHHFVDLVFYHHILKCFVLIDLKKEEAGYEDIGQMNMYLGYFAEEERSEGDNPPIGIILAREKDDLLIRYALHSSSSKLFVAKYQVYLPNEEELRAEVEKIYQEGEA